MRRKITALLISFCLIFEQSGFAQVAGVFDLSNSFSSLSRIDKFRPLQLRSVAYDQSQNGFDLLLDKGDLRNIKPDQARDAAEKLMEYFRIGVSLPNSVFWVNLRPDGKEDIIDPELERTDLGKILLAADLELKKDMARATSPQTAEGRQYWKKLYEKAESIFGSQKIDIPTLTRPWIVPGEIIVRQDSNSAYVYKATLKVMLEQDYLKNSATYGFDDPRLKEINEYSSELIRQLIIPQLTKKVNSSRTYADLRQVYYSLVLAQWFKQNFKGSGTGYAAGIDQKDLSGLTSSSDWSKDTYFKAYQKSFSEGEYNTQETVSGIKGMTIRRYFSGGITPMLQSGERVPDGGIVPSDKFAPPESLLKMELKTDGGVNFVPRDDRRVKDPGVIIAAEIKRIFDDVEESLRNLQEADSNLIGVYNTEVKAGVVRELVDLGDKMGKAEVSAALKEFIKPKIQARQRSCVEQAIIQLAGRNAADGGEVPVQGLKNLADPRVERSDAFKYFMILSQFGNPNNPQAVAITRQNLQSALNKQENKLGLGQDELRILEAARDFYLKITTNVDKFGLTGESIDGKNIRNLAFLGGVQDFVAVYSALDQTFGFTDAQKAKKALIGLLSKSISKQNTWEKALNEQAVKYLTTIRGIDRLLRMPGIGRQPAAAADGGTQAVIDKALKDSIDRILVNSETERMIMQKDLILLKKPQIAQQIKDNTIEALVSVSRLQGKEPVAAYLSLVAGSKDFSDYAREVSKEALARVSADTTGAVNTTDKTSRDGGQVKVEALKYLMNSDPMMREFVAQYFPDLKGAYVRYGIFDHLFSQAIDKLWSKDQIVDPSELNNPAERDIVEKAVRYLLDKNIQTVTDGIPSDLSDARTLGQARDNIEKYLLDQYNAKKISDEIYKDAVANTYKNLKSWITDLNIEALSPKTREAIFEAIRAQRWKDIVEVFRQEITFGTAGIRGRAALTEDELNLLNTDGPMAKILKGPNTINDIVLLRYTTGVARYARDNGLHKVAIGYDSRVAGDKFAEMIAQCFIGQSTPDYRFTVYLFDEASPFPELSFGVTTKEIRADLGILISASHNPADYNGYKITDETGSQLPQAKKGKVVEAISETTTADIKLKKLEEAPAGELVWLGNSKPIEGKDYKNVDVNNPAYFIDMHTLHVNQVKKFILDKGVVERQKDNLKIGFSAFNGAGYKAVPRLLNELGFSNVKTIAKLQELNGLFPAFGRGEQPDPGDSISADIAVREFITEHGQKAFDDLDILLGTDPDADRMGAIVKVPVDQQQLFGKYRLLSANDVWTLLIWYRLKKKQELGLLADPKNHYITFSHVTTDALEATAGLFGVRSLGEMYDKDGVKETGGYLNGRRSWVGFTYIADFAQKMRGRGMINEAGAEESNGFSILGGPVKAGDILAEDGHVNDKDGTLAGILAVEVAAYAKDNNTTIFKLLDDIYRQIGHYATANKPLPRVGSFEGAEGITEKINLLKKAQEWMEVLNNGETLTLGGRKVIGAVEFKSGRYDKQHYPGFPDEGVRFFFQDPDLKPGYDFHQSRNFITIRPSGTSQTIRFYTQLYSKPEDLTNAKKFDNYLAAERISLLAQKELLSAVGLTKYNPMVNEQLSKLDGGMAEYNSKGSRQLAAMSRDNKFDQDERVLIGSLALSKYVAENAKKAVTEMQFPVSEETSNKFLDALRGARDKYTQYGKAVRFPGVTVISNPSNPPEEGYKLFRELAGEIEKFNALESSKAKEPGIKIIAPVPIGSEHITIYDLISIADKIKGGFYEKTAFSGIEVNDKKKITAAESEIIWEQLRENGFLDDNGILKEDFTAKVNSLGFTGDLKETEKYIIRKLNDTQLKPNLREEIRERAGRLVNVRENCSPAQAWEQATYEVVAREVYGVLKGFQADQKPVFAPTQILTFTPDHPGPVVLGMAPKTAKDLALVTKIQDAIQERTGIRNFGNFTAHVSLGYLVSPIYQDKELFGRFQGLMVRLNNTITKAQDQEFELRGIDLSYFADMESFSPIASFSWTDPEENKGKAIDPVAQLKKLQKQYDLDGGSKVQDFMVEIDYIMSMLGIGDYPRIAETFRRSIDPVAFINELSRVSGKSVEEVRGDLGNIKFFKTLAADYRVLTARSFDRREFATRKLEVNVANSGYDIRGSLKSAAGQPISDKLDVMRDEVKDVPFVFRDNMEEFIGNFPSVTGEISSSGLLAIIMEAEKFLKTVNLNKVRYIVTSGIGANEMYSHQLAQLLNAYFRSQGIEVQWIVVNNPAHLKDRIPVEADNSNTIVFEMSRSGTTKETIDFFNSTSSRFTTRIVTANSGPLKAAALALRDNGGKVLIIGNTPGNIGGRQMNRKTLMVYLPLFIALTAGAKDAGKARSLLGRYVKALLEANKTLDYANGSASEAVELAEFLYRHRADGHNKFSVVCADSLKYSAKELFQLLNEGANKNIAGGSNNNILDYYSLTGDMTRYKKAFESEPSTQLPIFLLDPSAKEYAATLEYISDLQRERIPVITITVDGVSGEDIEKGLETTARVSALLQDMVVYFTYITNQDASSNPAVKMVREITKAMTDILKAKKASGSADIRISIADVINKLIETKKIDDKGSIEAIFAKNIQKKEAVPELSVFADALKDLSEALDISEGRATQTFIGALSADAVMADTGEAGGSKVSDILEAFRRSLIGLSFGTLTPDRVIPPLDRQVILRDSPGFGISGAAAKDDGFAASGAVSRDIADYLYAMYQKRKGTLQYLALTYMESDTGNPAIKEMAEDFTEKFAGLGITPLLLALPNVAHTGIEAAMSHPEALLNIAVIYTNTFGKGLGTQEVEKGVTIDDATYVYGISNVIRMALAGTPTIIFEVENNSRLAEAQAIIKEAMVIFRDKIAKGASAAKTDGGSVENKIDGYLKVLLERLQNKDSDRAERMAAARLLTERRYIQAVAPLIEALRSESGLQYRLQISDFLVKFGPAAVDDLEAAIKSQDSRGSDMLKYALNRIKLQKTSQDVTKDKTDGGDVGELLASSEVIAANLKALGANPEWLDITRITDENRPWKFFYGFCTQQGEIKTITSNRSNYIAMLREFEYAYGRVRLMTRYNGEIIKNQDEIVKVLEGTFRALNEQPAQSAAGLDGGSSIALEEFDALANSDDARLEGLRIFIQKMMGIELDPGILGTNMLREILKRANDLFKHYEEINSGYVSDQDWFYVSTAIEFLRNEKAGGTRQDGGSKTPAIDETNAVDHPGRVKREADAGYKGPTGDSNSSPDGINRDAGLFDGGSKMPTDERFNPWDTEGKVKRENIDKYNRSVRESSSSSSGEVNTGDNNAFDGGTGIYSTSGLGTTLEDIGSYDYKKARDLAMILAKHISRGELFAYFTDRLTVIGDVSVEGPITIGYKETPSDTITILSIPSVEQRGKGIRVNSVPPIQIKINKSNNDIVLVGNDKQVVVPSGLPVSNADGGSDGIAGIASGLRALGFKTEGMSDTEILATGRTMGFRLTTREYAELEKDKDDIDDIASGLRAQGFKTEGMSNADILATGRTMGFRPSNSKKTRFEEDGGNQVADGGVTPKDDVGGIDLRGLSIASQPAVGLMRIPVMPNLVGAVALEELDKQWMGIRTSMAQGEMPYLKIKEYIACCSARPDSSKQIQAVTACVADILKAEEEDALPTCSQLKEILVQLG